MTAILCSLLLQGQVEVRHDYVAAGQDRHIRVDCETATHVVEVGFDGQRSSYDSIHQALFAAELTGKLPMVVIIDRDGQEEAVQYQNRRVARRVGMSYLTVSEAFLIRWQMTQPFREGQPVPLFGMDPAALDAVNSLRAGRPGG
ncbi:hypothetical protein [Oceanicola sp. 22II-s10i]|uniref:hypothetical protein n=1 Tax=Oceanicola sp. 22II-s10i TaxID=1317116 RepID=UPI001595F660|nr:hypothetical protein [Oceanicola sp. 22II-s10i]